MGGDGVLPCIISRCHAGVTCLAGVCQAPASSKCNWKYGKKAVAKEYLSQDRYLLLPLCRGLAHVTEKKIFVEDNASI